MEKEAEEEEEEENEQYSVCPGSSLCTTPLNVEVYFLISTNCKEGKFELRYGGGKEEELEVDKKRGMLRRRKLRWRRRRRSRLRGRKKSWGVE